MVETLSKIPEAVKWNIPREFEGIMNYNPRHDIQDYLDLRNLNVKIPTHDYSELQTQTNRRTRRQLEKAIGERFGVEKSIIEYFIDAEGKLRSPDYPEPVVERYEKGRRFLAAMGSTETTRETAEVNGIANVEQIFRDLTPDKDPAVEDQTFVIISARGKKGSLYTDNCFDIYQKKSNRITMTRYHSTHPLEGFAKAAQQLDPTFTKPLDQPLAAAYFLERPLSSKLPIDKILDLMALDKTAQEERINQEIVETCTPFILSYIRTLTENPLNIEEIKLTFNTIFNVADETEKGIQKTKVKAALTLLKSELKFASSENLSPTALAIVSQQIDHYGRQPVRTVMRGCPGGQKGFSVTSQPDVLRDIAKLLGVKSVVDFATLFDDEDEEVTDFQCPGYKKDGSKCTYVVKAYSGVSKCPECGAGATCPA